MHDQAVGVVEPLARAAEAHFVTCKETLDSILVLKPGEDVFPVSSPEFKGQWDRLHWKGPSLIAVSKCTDTLFLLCKRALVLLPDEFKNMCDIKR